LHPEGHFVLRDPRLDLRVNPLLGQHAIEAFDLLDNLALRALADPFRVADVMNRIALGLKLNALYNIELSEDMKMAARNFKNIPEHILKKLKRNQNGLGSEEEGSKDKTD
jgi:hypothetical protein